MPDAAAMPDAIAATARPNGHDVVLVGGGLAASLIALRLAEQRPELSLLVLERGPEIAGSHTWSFHETDLSPESTRWIDALVAKRWDGQSVSFPKRKRRMRVGYRSLTSASVRAALEGTSNIHLRTNAEVRTLSSDEVEMADGEHIPAPLVIDARGHGAAPAHFVLAWQKFVGLVLDVPEGHGVTDPVIMDATVPQLDGYRFVYLLPQDERRILVEDTRYSDGPALDREGMRAAIMEYAREKGWGVPQEVHSEDGVLPIALAHDAKAMWREMPRDAVPVGMRAGLFHAITGYSMPLAVRVAELIADSPDLRTAPVFERVHGFAMAEAKRQWFFRFLNRMLFRGCAPERRWRLMQRFYGLRESLIERFYADRLTWYDKLRIVSGKPPIPIHRGLRCMPETPLLRELT